MVKATEITNLLDETNNKSKQEENNKPTSDFKSFARGNSACSTYECNPLS